MSPQDEEEAHQLLQTTERQVPQRCLRPAAVVLALLGSVGAATGLAIRAPRDGIRLAGTVQLDSLSHWTKWGSVPDKLKVSGVSCSLNKGINGVYSFQGRTADGRPYYRHEINTYYLYYDQECDGGKDNRWGAWYFKYSDTAPSTTATVDLDEDSDCSSAAFSIYPSQDDSHIEVKDPWEHSAAAGALPGSKTHWNVNCDGGHDAKVLEILAVKSTLKVQGHWVYLKTAMPGEKIQLTHGVQHRSDRMGSQELDKMLLAAGDSPTAAGVEYMVHDGEEPKEWVEVSSGEKLKRAWSSSVKVRETQGYTFQLPKEPGNNALWQWQFKVYQDNQLVADVRSSDYALTPSASSQHRPRCFPGFCDPKDVPHYQTCVEGGELP